MEERRRVLGRRWVGMTGKSRDQEASSAGKMFALPCRSPGPYPLRLPRPPRLQSDRIIVLALSSHFNMRDFTRFSTSVQFKGSGIVALSGQLIYWLFTFADFLMPRTRLPIRNGTSDRLRFADFRQMSIRKTIKRMPFA
jgi:hypothetical protein